MKIRLCAFADEAGKMLEEQIDALNRNDIGLLELRNVNGQNVADITLEDAANIKEKLDANNIKVWAIGSPLGKIKIEDDFDAHLQKLDHILKLCKIFECDKIRMFSFFTAEYSRVRAKVITQLNQMVERAKKEGVTLYHENEKEIYGDTVERVLDLKENVPGLEFIYDPANYVQTGQDIQEALDKALDFSAYFHIKDVVEATGELVPAGHGDGKIKEMIERINIDTVLTIEPHLSLFDGYAQIDGSEMKTKFKFETNSQAFDAAVNALEVVLKDCGYGKEKGGWTK